MTPLDPSTLPPVFVQRGGDPEFVAQELMYAIKAHIGRHPRTQQVEIGPSEIDTECPRKLAYKLAGVEPVNDGPAWFPTIGTAVHSWLEAALQAENREAGS